MKKKIYSLADFKFDLPDDLIAQFPVETRDESKLFILNRKSKSYQHKNFKQLVEQLSNNDLLIFNNARVIHARIFFTRESGGEVEITLIQKVGNYNWLAISNRTKRLKLNESLCAIKNREISIKIKSKVNNYIEIITGVDFSDELLADIGEIPLPPYIKRNPVPIDEKRYQTVYASKSGAVAAPTAGLHFTEDIFNKLKKEDVDIDFITLDISWGTFQPVRFNELWKHKMHIEKYCLERKTAEKINRARSNGKRIVAVGTTTVRVLESTFSKGKNEPDCSETDIFIYPPSKIKSIDALLTNFHTPGSTLLMLAASFAGYEQIMAAYDLAVELKYRFFSYGDAMLIE